MEERHGVGDLAEIAPGEVLGGEAVRVLLNGRTGPLRAVRQGREWNPRRAAWMVK